ncbi:MAG: NADP oxidoreductase [Nitrospinota bacterium]|nr:NADP oxidoreductase [Nitrospinota bacterium]MDH5755797.1 NADP oxidoreductase [Nitrospinota bacterium]
MKRIATVSLAGCFGCHMSLLDIDERIVDLLKLVEFDRSPLNDLKSFTGRCDIGFIEGSCCNEENVATLREFRKQCQLLVGVGQCAIMGGLPVMRNAIMHSDEPLLECLEESFTHGPGVYNPSNEIPNDPALPLLLDRVYLCSEVVRLDYVIPGCPPSGDLLWEVLSALVLDKPIHIPPWMVKYD